MILQNRYVIAVPNLERSAAFYRDVLGFTIREIGDPGWRFYELDGCIVMAGECVDAIPPAELGDHSYFAYIVLDELQPLIDRLLSIGTVEVVKHLRDEPWGMREVGIRTVDGHRIMFGQQIAG